jgi:hypothetical protein
LSVATDESDLPVEGGAVRVDDPDAVAGATRWLF